MGIYLDNAATTRCDKEVAAAVEKALLEAYGNPSSMHRMGFEAEQQVKQAVHDLSTTLKVQPEEIVFTSGGTESDNMALFGVARACARLGKHILTTPIEHAAVARTAEALKEEGFEIELLPVDGLGRVDPEAVRASVRPDTILVSVMAVNNEIGTVQDLAAIAKAAKEKNPAILFHTDAVQGYGKIPLDVRKAGIDLLAASGHKFHGPKGTGFLYIKKGTRIRPLIYGGGQQKGQRSGTDNVPGILGMTLAAVKANRALESFGREVSGLRDDFIGMVKERVENVTVNGPAGSTDPDIRAFAAPHIVSLSVPGVRAEVLLHALEDKEIYVSAGSACSSHAAGKLPGTATLRAIGLDAASLPSTIRISLSRETTKEELTETAQALEALVPALRRYT